MKKVAELKVKSFNDMVKKLKELKAAGKNFGEDSAEEYARKMMYNKGCSGSIFVDGANKLLNVISGKRKLGDMASVKISNVQRKLADADIRAGHKIQSTLEKRKFTKGLSNMFTYKHDIPLVPNVAGKADEVLKLSVPALTAPVERAKDAVLPMAGALYINQKIYDNNKEKQEKDGEGKMKNEKTAEMEYRSRLIAKISNAISCGSDNLLKTASVKQSSNSCVVDSNLLRKASGMLKNAARVQHMFQEDLQKLAEENEKLSNELAMIKRAEEAKDVANMMVSKRMIPISEINNKVNELLNMDKAAFDTFRKAIMDVQIEKVANTDEVDDLTYLLSSNNIVNKEKPTFADALANE